MAGGVGPLVEKDQPHLLRGQLLLEHDFVPPQPGADHIAGGQAGAQEDLQVLVPDRPQSVVPRRVQGLPRPAQPPDPDVLPDAQP